MIASASRQDNKVIHHYHVDDNGDVLILAIGRMMEVQIDEGLPIFVILVRPLECIIAQLNEK